MIMFTNLKAVAFVIALVVVMVSGHTVNKAVPVSPPAAPLSYNESIVRKATLYSEEYKLNDQYALIVDMSQSANKHRVFLVNIQKQKIEYSGFTSHGRGGGNTRLKATRFSNAPGSLMTSLGVYRTTEQYIGKHGLSLRLVGLVGTNSNAYRRSVVLHPAFYVTAAYVKENHFPGMSEGCIGMDPAISKVLISKLRSDSLVYVFTETKNK